MADSPKGILRNRDEGKSPASHGDTLDRQEVIKNTELNALMNNESTKGDAIRRKIQAAKQQRQGLESAGAGVGVAAGAPGARGDAGVDDDTDRHAKWDEINLYKSEQERSATMKIDEPKTPYEGGFDPTGEYYQEDLDEDIPDFELGKSQVNEEPIQSLNGGEVLPNDDDDDDDAQQEQQEPPLTAEERHRRFEEKRKQHYHMKGEALRTKIDISDDDD